MGAEKLCGTASPAIECACRGHSQMLSELLPICTVQQWITFPFAWLKTAIVSLCVRCSPCEWRQAVRHPQPVRHRYGHEPPCGVQGSAWQAPLPAVEVCTCRSPCLFLGYSVLYKGAPENCGMLLCEGQRTMRSVNVCCAERCAVLSLVRFIPVTMCSTLLPGSTCLTYADLCCAVPYCAVSCQVHLPRCWQVDSPLDW